jgi:hypothetical protein
MNWPINIKNYCRFWYVDIIENYVRFYIIVTLSWLEWGDASGGIAVPSDEHHHQFHAEFGTSTC